MRGGCYGPFGGGHDIPDTRDRAGDVSLPPELASEMGLKPGDWLQVDREGTG